MQHSLASAAYAVIAAKSGGAIEAVVASVPGSRNIGGGSLAGSGSTPTLAPGAAGAAERGQARKEAPVVVPMTVNYNFNSPVYAQQGIDRLAQDLSEAVERRDVHLTSRRSLLPAYSSR